MNIRPISNWIEIFSCFSFTIVITNISDWKLEIDMNKIKWFFCFVLFLVNFRSIGWIVWGRERKKCFKVKIFVLFLFLETFKQTLMFFFFWFLVRFADFRSFQNGTQNNINKIPDWNQKHLFDQNKKVSIEENDKIDWIDS